jgi:hypothetical protein
MVGQREVARRVDRLKKIARCKHVREALLGIPIETTVDAKRTL